MEQKVAIYTRVSTVFQVDKDSLNVQKRELIAYAEMILGITEHVIFEDPGYSGKNTDRPKFQEMMSRVRKGEFSHILVWKIDRISRNLLDFTEMYSELKKLGVVFVSKNEQFDTSSAIGEAMLKIILIFAELERNMTSERVSAVMVSRAENGQWNGGRIPYGYTYNKEDKSFSINPEEAEIVKLIFNNYLKYRSIIAIAREFNDKGLKTRLNRYWSIPGVYKILTSRFYLGDYVYNVNGSKKDKSNVVTIQNHHPPIITEDIYNATKSYLENNRRGGTRPGTPYVRKNIHIFAGIAKCGVCGSNMVSNYDNRRDDGFAPSKYSCLKHRSDATTCDNKYTSDVIIVPVVFTLIGNIICFQKKVSSSTSVDTFIKKIMSGKSLDRYDIDRQDAACLLAKLKSRIGKEYYTPTDILSENEFDTSELAILKEQYTKNENALNRIKSIYLYGNTSTADEFIKEHDAIVNKQKVLEKKISELIKSEKQNELHNDSLERKATYMIMQSQLEDPTNADFIKMIRSGDRTVPKAFVVSIIHEIYFKYGFVSCIKFKNGIELHFTPKQ